MSPNGGPIAGGTTVTITGTNFVSGATVHFGSKAGTSVNVQSATTLTAVAPAGSGTVDVTVSTPGGPSTTSSADQYAYGPPSVSAVNPVTGPTTGGNTVTITGTNFVSGATVDFGSNAGTSVNVQSSTTLTAVAPAGSDGTVDVTVSTPGGSSATSSADQYAYTPQAGTVFAVDTGNTAGSGQLVQMLPSGAQTTLASGLNDPSGVAVDAAGDVFVVIFNSDVVEYPADGSGQRTLAGSGYPVSLAVDAQGDVFVGNGYGVQEFPAGGGVRSRSTRTSRIRLAWRWTVRVMCSSRATRRGQRRCGRGAPERDADHGGQRPEQPAGSGRRPQGRRVHRGKRQQPGGRGTGRGRLANPRGQRAAGPHRRRVRCRRQSVHRRRLSRW